MNSNQAKAAKACERVTALLQRSFEVERQHQMHDHHTLRVPLIAYALATLRQRVAPALSPCWSKDPTHIAMFGGTNSGKSTVLNVLLGQPAAGMNFLARYTQHPSAFAPNGQGDGFLVNYPTRFQGYQRFDGQQPPRQSDQALRRNYQPALSLQHLEPDHALTPPVTSDAIFWDVPDYSTEEATFYMTAVLDAIATADLVLIVVTNESYAGHRDRLLRQLIVDSGVPVHVVANKLQDGSRLLDDIKRKVCNDDAINAVPADRIHPLPLISGCEEMSDRLQRLIVTQEAAVLRQQIAEELTSSRLLKKQALTESIEFLDRRFQDLFAPLQAEVEIANQWANVVNRATEKHIYQPYKQNYLDGQNYADFNLAFLQFLNLLELPGLGKVIAGAANGLRGASRFVLQKVFSIFGGGEKRTVSKEQEILEEGFKRSLAEIKAFAQQQAEQTGHPKWLHLAQRMDQATFLDEMGESLGKAWLQHRKNMENLISVRAQALRQYVEERPNLRKTLQSAKFAADTTAVVTAVVTGGLDPTDLLIGPAVLVMLRTVIEVAGEQFVENQKKALKQEQYAAMQQVIDRQMVEPTGRLFQAATSAQELHMVQADFVLMKQVALEIAQI